MYFSLILLSMHLLSCVVMSLRELLNLLLDLLVPALCNLKHSVTKGDACCSLMLAVTEIIFLCSLLINLLQMFLNLG